MLVWSRLVCTQKSLSWRSKYKTSISQGIGTTSWYARSRSWSPDIFSSVGSVYLSLESWVLSTSPMHDHTCFGYFGWSNWPTIETWSWYCRQSLCVCRSAFTKPSLWWSMVMARRWSGVWPLGSWPKYLVDSEERYYHRCCCRCRRCLWRSQCWQMLQHHGGCHWSLELFVDVLLWRSWWCWRCDMVVGDVEGLRK